MNQGFGEPSSEAAFVSIGQASSLVLRGLGLRLPCSAAVGHHPAAAPFPRQPSTQGATGVISTTIQNVERAEPVLDSGLSWVILRLGGNNRVTIHTVNYGQAVAVADAFNSELEAREDGRR